MLTGSIKRTIDNARNVLVGKIPDPKSQIEQITIAMIYKFMDDMDLESIEFGGKSEFFTDELEQYAWHKMMSPKLGAEARMNLYTEALNKLPLATKIPPLFRQIFKGAYLPFRDGQTLSLFLKEINDLSYDNSENLGNAFEYLLSIMSAQGDAGQFRTPRHIIDFIVKVVNPKKNDRILDPACGTAGFLISAYKHILDCAKKEKKILTPTELKNLTENFEGYDISPDMVKLALVNMYLHKFKDPKIVEYDTLTKQDRWDDYFDTIFANPPFMTPKGGIQPHDNFGIKANRSEVLFVDYIMEHINSTGKAGVIVPEGIIFQSANAYKELRKKLVEDNYLWAVVSLPSGVFNPYSGVKTSILLMDKEIAKKSDSILFIDIKNDGYDLGAQRREIDKDDLPEALKALNVFKSNYYEQNETIQEKLKHHKLVNLVKKSKIAENEDYFLAGSRYSETVDYSNCKWKMVNLDEILNYEQPTNYIVDNIDYNDRYKTPVLTAGQSFILGYTNEKNGIFEDNLPVIIFDDFTTATKFVDFPFKVKSSAMKILKAKENIANIKYIYYAMQQIEFNSETHKRYWISEYSKIAIPVPPLEIQEEIVKELDAYKAVIDGAKKVVENWKPIFPINPNWKKVKLGEICSLYQGLAINAKTQHLLVKKSNLPLLRIKDLKENIETQYINPENYPVNALINEDDIIYTRTGSLGLVFRGRKGILHNNSFKVVASDKLNKDFLFRWLQNPEFKSKIVSLAARAAQPDITHTLFKQQEMPLPPLDEQREIVAKIEIEEQAVEQCKKLIELYEQKISDKIKSIWGESCNIGD